jgi:hypothetical protein
VSRFVEHGLRRAGDGGRRRGSGRREAQADEKVEVRRVLPSLVVAGVGVVLLVALVVIVQRPIARFVRARTALQDRVVGGAAALRALRDARRPAAAEGERTSVEIGTHSPPSTTA